MLSFLKTCLTWWHRRTLGTALYTWRHGVLQGSDEFGQRYYASRDGKRRWVIYADAIEASLVPPRWHDWLHHIGGEVPTDKLPHAWSKPHQANPTGSEHAHRPHAEQHYTPQSYEAWTPMTPTRLEPTEKGKPHETQSR